MPDVWGSPMAGHPVQEERTAEASPPPSPALPGKGPESGCGREGGLVRLVR